MAFKGTKGVYERIYCFNCNMNKKKREICEFEMDFKNLFCCCSNISNEDIICKRLSPRMGIDIRGQVCKTGVKNGIVGHEKGSGFV